MCCCTPHSCEYSHTKFGWISSNSLGVVWRSHIGQTDGGDHKSPGALKKSMFISYTLYVYNVGKGRN